MDLGNLLLNQVTKHLNSIFLFFRHQPKSHVLANVLVILKWLLKKILDEIIDYVFQHFLPTNRRPDSIANLTEKILLKFN